MKNKQVLKSTYAEVFLRIESLDTKQRIDEISIPLKEYIKLKKFLLE